MPSGCPEPQQYQQVVIGVTCEEKRFLCKNYLLIEIVRTLRLKVNPEEEKLISSSAISVVLARIDNTNRNTSRICTVNGAVYRVRYAQPHTPLSHLGSLYFPVSCSSFILSYILQQFHGYFGTISVVFTHKTHLKPNTS
jgi:hypothetical protein